MNASADTLVRGYQHVLSQERTHNGFRTASTVWPSGRPVFHPGPQSCPGELSLCPMASMMRLVGSVEGIHGAHGSYVADTRIHIYQFMLMFLRQAIAGTRHVIEKMHVNKKNETNKYKSYKTPPNLL